MTVWLVRHGATDWTDAGRFNGWTDVPLNERGIEQAHELATTLELSDDVTIWSSDLIRARSTAAALGPPRIDARLRELDFGELEGLTWGRCDLATREALVAFDGFVAPGGESVAALGARIDAFLADLFRDGRREGEHVVVTHGGVIRLFLRRHSGDRHVAPGEAVRLPVERWPVAPESDAAHNRYQ